jgi:hypothetical protein
VSRRATDAVWQFSEVPTATVFVFLLALADNCDHEGVCHWTVDRLADQARMARATAYRSLKTAQELGEVTRAHAGGNGRGDVSTYRLALVDKLVIKRPAPRHLTPDAEASEKRPKSVRAVRPIPLRPLDTESRAGARTREDGNESAPGGAFVPAYEHPDVVPAAEIPGHMAAVRAGLTRPPTGRPPAPREPAITAVPPDPIAQCVCGRPRHHRGPCEPAITADPPTLEVLEGAGDGEGLA